MVRLRRMNRAQRLLILYSRLTKKQYVNKEEIAHEFDVHPRTIQRDIEDIREYLSDSNEHFYRQEIIYNHSENGYTISNHHVLKNSLPLRMILIQLYSQSPVIHNEIYETLKLIINDSYSHDIQALSNLLSEFKVIESNIEYQLVSQLQDAIREKDIINIILENDMIYNVIPIKIFYRHTEFHLIIKENNDEKTIRCDRIKSIQKEGQAKASKKQVSTLEMSKAVWYTLKDLFEVVLIESISDDSIIVTFNITKVDLFDTLLKFSPYIRLVNSPFANDFYSHLLSLNQTYFTQQIMLDSKINKTNEE